MTQEPVTVSDTRKIDVLLLAFYIRYLRPNVQKLTQQKTP